MLAKEAEVGRQIFLLGFGRCGGAKEGMVGEEEVKPRVGQTEARVGKKKKGGSFGVPSLVGWGGGEDLLGKGCHVPSRGHFHEAG